MDKKITSIIFDWDNTLFNFNDYWEVAHEEAFNQFGFYHLIDYGVFISKYKYFDKLLWEDVLNEKISLDDLRIKRLVNTLDYFDIKIDDVQAYLFFNVFFQILLKKIEPNYPLIDKINRLRKNYQLCILTNGKLEEQKEKIRRFKFEGLIPYYVSEEIGYEKPNEKAFLYVLNNIGALPSETVMIGDSLDNDIKPAAKLGLTTIYIGKKRNTIADYSFTDIDGAIDLLMNGKR